MNLKNAMHNQRMFIAGLVAFAVACCLLLLPGCVDEDTAAQADGEAAKQAEETVVSQAAEAEQDGGIEVRLTDEYMYYLPGDAVESFGFDKAEGFTDERYFLLKDGKTIVRSFIVTDEPDCFPDLVEYWYQDVDADVGYSPFYDTALATAEDEITDAEGNKLYRKAYFWPSGGETLCSLSVAAPAKDDLEVAGSLLKTVKYLGGSNQASGEVPPNAEQSLTPSQEELDQAMMQDAQESMQNQYPDGDHYMDYDSSLGKRR